MSLRSLYETGVSLSRLAEGHHEITISSFEFHQGKTPDLDYVRVTMQFPDRTINDNRFEQGFNIFLSHIKKQFNWEDETVTVQALLQRVIEQPKVDVWVNYTTADNGNTYRNFNFIPPIVRSTAPAVNTDTLADSELLV